MKNLLMGALLALSLSSCSTTQEGGSCKSKEEKSCCCKKKCGCSDKKNCGCKDKKGQCDLKKRKK